MSKERAAELARNAGVLGFLNDRRSPIAAVLGSDMAIGSDPQTVLGGLQGIDIGAATGIRGLGMTGSGAGGGGTGVNTLGTGNLPRMGHLGLGTGGNGTDYGRGVGQLTNRHTKTPVITTGIVRTVGSLDKEIVRRIIRSHMNEVKFCYEQELTKHADLAGRISVQFSISSLGQVIASVMQSSTMGNVQVESCVVNAVKRWSFPKPEGGGLVMVMYPFSFAPAGG
jgi:TonB family protein